MPSYLLALAQVGIAAGGAPPFWGTPTSSVNWCEADYGHSRYICEWFNTISSVAMIAAGAIGWSLHRRVLERRLSAAFALLALVGIGSAAFHATLRFELQMLDELPMVYLALLILYALLDERPSRLPTRWLAAGLVAYAAVVTVMMSGTRGPVEFWTFESSFTALEALCVYRLVKLSRRSQWSEVRCLVRIGLGFYFVGIAVWFIDLRFCSFVAATLPAHGLTNPQLHAVWHVLSTSGLYCILLALGCTRLHALGRSPRVARRCRMIPCVVVEAASSTAAKA